MNLIILLDLTVYYTILIGSILYDGTLYDDWNIWNVNKNNNYNNKNISKRL